MRLIPVTLVGLAVGGVLGAMYSGRAGAQMAPLTPPPVATPERPNTAIEGTITASSARGAVLQRSDGTSVQLSFVPRGYLLVDPSPQALGPGMRVFAVGYPQQDGAVAVEEIDVLPPLDLLSQTPAPAATPVPTPTSS